VPEGYDKPAALSAGFRGGRSFTLPRVDVKAIQSYRQFDVVGRSCRVPCRQSGDNASVMYIDVRERRRRGPFVLSTWGGRVSSAGCLRLPIRLCKTGSVMSSTSTPSERHRESDATIKSPSPPFSIAQLI